MLSRFLLSALALILFLMALAVPMFIIPRPLLVSQLEMHGDLIIFGFFAVAAPLMLLFMDWCAKHIFYFKGRGPPFPEDGLRKEILSINHYDVPIVAAERDDKIELTWNYLDTRWQGVISKLGITRMFKVSLRFDPQRHLVTMLDTHGSFSRGVGGNLVRWTWFRGIYLNFSVNRSATIRQRFEKNTDYENMFNTEDIHNPVMNTILGCGWDVRFAII
jgi:hypothetical protein